MFSSRTPMKTPQVSAFLKSLEKEETNKLKKLYDYSNSYLSNCTPLYEYNEVPLKKNSYSFIDEARNIRKSENLIVLLWDCTSPFTGEKIDIYSQKVQLLKQKLDISQDGCDDFEVKRASTTWNPMAGSNYESQFPPRVDKALFREPGTYTHYSDRHSFDLGFLTASALPTTSIEYNKQWQTRLEKVWNGSNSEIPELVEYVKNDTTYNRLQNLMSAFAEFFVELIRLKEDKKMFQNIYIILNPLLNVNDPTHKYISSITKMIVQKHLEKDEFRAIVSNLKIISITKVQSETNTYVPSEKAAKAADQLVIFFMNYYIYLFMQNFIYVYLYIYNQFKKDPTLLDLDR